MDSSRKPAALRAAVAALVVAVVWAASPAAVAGAAAVDGGPALSFSGVSFAVKQVDVRAGTAMVALNWTVENRDGTATTVRGIVSVQQFSRSRSVGPARLVYYALSPDGVGDTFAVVGDAQHSRYSYAFPVPRYGPTGQTTWRVTRITATDDRGHSRTLSGEDVDRFHAELSATGLVDSTGPTVGYLSRQQEEFVFDAGAGAGVLYNADVLDAEAGFWKGRLDLTGPGGVQVAAAFEVVDTGEFFQSCGQSPVFDTSDVICDITVNLPAAAPAGTWVVSALELTDNAGNTTRHTDVDAGAIRLTRNDVLTAADFSVNPTVVNNWRQSVLVAVTLQPVGVQGGLASFAIRTDNCFGALPDVTTNPDGTATVQWQISTFVQRCAITGIILLDGAGNLALYGSYFGAPPIDLEVVRLPDTVPPVAISATLSRTTATASELLEFGNIGVNVFVDTTSPAPVTSGSVTFYNSEGISVGGGNGGLFEEDGGLVRVLGVVRGLPPGVYTAGFTLFDAAGNFTHYGYPNGVGQPAPSGPLTLTVTDG